MIQRIINAYVKNRFSRKEAPEELLEAMAEGLRHKHREKIDDGCAVIVMTVNIKGETEESIEELELIQLKDR
jgi:hypothetical protein